MGLDSSSFSNSKYVYDFNILDKRSNTYGITDVTQINNDVEEAYSSEEEISRNNKVLNEQHELYKGSNNYDSESFRNREASRRVFGLAQTTAINDVVRHESQSQGNINKELENSSFNFYKKAQEYYNLLKAMIIEPSF